jgi:hypothetical protein
LHRAEELKLEGNDYFRARRWDEALSAYRTALGQLPKKEQDIDSGKNGRIPDALREEDSDVPTTRSGKDKANPDEAEPPESVPTELDTACAKARAVLNANIGACYVRLVSPSQSS